MSTSDWAEEALTLLLDRVARTDAEVGPRFPLHADPRTGHWTTTSRGSWTGGFWAGLLWLHARRTTATAAGAATAESATAADSATAPVSGATAADSATAPESAATAAGSARAPETGADSDSATGADFAYDSARAPETGADSDSDSATGADFAYDSAYDSARAVTARLAPWVEADTVVRGLILWYGTALADGEPAAGRLRERAARAVLDAWEPGAGVVPWGAALGGARMRVRADGAPGTVPLLASAGPDGERAAAAHLHRHLDLCLPDAAERPVPAWRFDAVARQWAADDDPAPGWARGEAWLLLAVADGLLRARTPVWRPKRLAEAAEVLLHQGGFLTGPPVPSAHADRPDGPVDTSAAAIGAVALLKLGYTDRAETVLRHLARAHLTRPGGPGPPGMLLDGCYDAHAGTAVRHELVWGDFFLALGLAALLGQADLTRV
ncbi:sugar ABC transporter permease [Streptomyces sp. NPDC053493]|uniref:sugar ABC transporter permease n=1 Tax=Streptomyces sp. NPDC053493 TaxID=3365705 RepID=UPI0037D3D21A